MPRITISVTDRTHRALREAAARQGRSMGAIVEESLVLRGILPSETARDPSDTARELVALARSSSGLSDDEAMAIAVRETRAHRTANDG